MLAHITRWTRATGTSNSKPRTKTPNQAYTPPLACCAFHTAVADSDAARTATVQDAEI